MNKPYAFYNEDCIEGCKKRIADNSVDLIITDPPYGINGDTLHKHYNRKEEFVLDGYIEIPQEEYAEFTGKWIEQAARILRPGGSLYVVSGYTNLPDILNALRATRLKEMNHIIWKYNFGVYTKKKYVSSHYHILFYVKPGASHTFNTHCRFGADEKGEDGRGSLNYLDREDVWIINREYKHGKTKNKNELPKELLQKLIQYSSNKGDLICDLFLGSFSTAKVSIGMNRRIVGFEESETAYKHQMKEISQVKPGELLKTLRIPSGSKPANQGKPWTGVEKRKLLERYNDLRPACKTKRKTIDQLSEEFGRGYFAILNVIDQQQDQELSLLDGL